MSPTLRSPTASRPGSSGGSSRRAAGIRTLLALAAALGAWALLAQTQGGLTRASNGMIGIGVIPTTAFAAAQPFAQLPACAASSEGARGAVSDAATNTWGATITGSGANHVLAYCDGAHWTVAAK